MHAHTCVDKHNHVIYASIREVCGCLEFSGLALSEKSLLSDKI